MIATAAVAGVRERADDVACCVALALREADGGDAPLVITPGGPERRPALLASAAATEVEAAIAAAALEGVAAAARGHLCVVSVAADVCGEAIAPILDIAGRGRVVVASAEPAGLELWQRSITLVRAELPADREVLTLLADSLDGAAGVLRVDKRGPGRIGARRALAGLEPGRAPSARYRWLCRGI